MLDLLELELQKIVSCHMSLGIQTQAVRTASSLETTSGMEGHDNMQVLP